MNTELDALGLVLVPVPQMTLKQVRTFDDWMSVAAPAPFVWATAGKGLVTRKAHEARVRAEIATAVAHAKTVRSTRAAA